MRMKRRTDKICLLVAITLLLCAAGVRAQEDSTRVRRDSVRTSFSGSERPVSSYGAASANDALPVSPLRGVANPLPQFRPNPADAPPYYTNPSPLFRGDFSTGGTLGVWRGNVFTGSGSQTSIPGIGRMNEAAVGYARQLNDRLALQASINAVKLNMSHFNAQAFGLSTALTYRADEHLWFTAYGSANMGRFPGMKTYQYGGTMGFDIGERFSLELGVERYYNSMTGRWETRPVVIPTYKFNDKFKLGFDVGPLIYEVIRGIVTDKKDHGGGPMIRPEVPGYGGRAFR